MTSIPNRPTIGRPYPLVPARPKLAEMPANQRLTSRQFAAFSHSGILSFFLSSKSPIGDRQDTRMGGYRRRPRAGITGGCHAS
jgi:hypothetical protein